MGIARAGVARGNVIDLTRVPAGVLVPDDEDKPAGVRSISCALIQALRSMAATGLSG